MSSLQHGWSQASSSPLFNRGKEYGGTFIFVKAEPSNKDYSVTVLVPVAVEDQWTGLEKMSLLCDVIQVCFVLRPAWLRMQRREKRKVWKGLLVNSFQRWLSRTWVEGYWILWKIAARYTIIMVGKIESLLEQQFWNAKEGIVSPVMAFVFL